MKYELKIVKIKEKGLAKKRNEKSMEKTLSKNFFERKGEKDLKDILEEINDFLNR